MKRKLLLDFFFFLGLQLRQSKMFRSEQEVGGSLSVGEELFTGVIFKYDKKDLMLQLNI